MEKEEKGNMNMTVGVVLTVAVAILLLVAMIPAMMPAQEGGEAHTYHYVRFSDEFMDQVTVTYIYVDENGESSGEIASYFEPSTVVERNADGYLKYWLMTTGVDTLTFNGGPDSVEIIETDEGDPLTPHVYTDAASLYASYDASRGPGFASAELMWDCLTCPNVVLAGETFDPAHAVPDEGGSSGGSVDTNTVLIGAIISLMFISIALVAVRSFRA